MKRLILVYFFLSGICGLIYEVLWSHLFAIVMGGTVYSFTTVLVAFMSGLALGGYLGGKIADKSKINHLLLYGILEGAIGIFCLFIPLLIKSLAPLFNLLYPLLEEQRVLMLMVRFLASVAILILPTTLMGATLPVLVRYSYVGRDRFGFTTGHLYAINTFGAVAGSFVSGFFLIPALGEVGTIYLSAGINLLIAFSIFSWWARKARSESIEVPKGVFDASISEWSFKAILIVICYGLSGAIAMLYQVAWTKALILSLGTTLYVLSLILSSYISGLALGGATGSIFVDKLKKPFFWIGVIELVIGLSSWSFLPFIDNVPLLVARIRQKLSYEEWLLIVFLIGFCLIIMPTFFMGMLLPLVSKVYSSVRGGVGQAIGEVYSANTIGAIFGSFICGFFLISFLGLRNTILLGVSVSIFLGTIFLLISELGRYRRIGLGFFSTILIVLLFLFKPGWEARILSSGAYQYFEDYQVYAQEGLKGLADYLKRTRLLFYKEGAEATVAVMEDSEGTTRFLRINGKTDASTSADMTTQILCGELPMMLHPSPKKVMVLGLASGVTLGSVLLHSALEVDCVEISPEVVDAEKFFRDFNNNALEDRRVNLIINDGRYHLNYTPKRYDVIISEPSNPWISGMGLLFTVEFFELAKKRLNEDGIMLIWLGVYDMDLESAKVVINSFYEVFPQSTLWEASPGYDYLLIGFKNKVQIDFNRFELALKNRNVKADLKRVELDVPEKILARLIMGPQEIELFAQGAPLHRDNKRTLEINIPRIRAEQSYGQRVSLFLQEIIKMWVSPKKYISPDYDLLEPQVREKLERYRKSRISFSYALVQAMTFGPDSPFAQNELLAAFELDPDDLSIARRVRLLSWTRASTLIKQGRIDEAIPWMERIALLDLSASELPTFIANYYRKQSKPDKAYHWLSVALERNDKDANAWIELGYLELEQNKLKDAETAFRNGITNYPFFREKFFNSRKNNLKELFSNSPNEFEVVAYQGLAEVLIKERKYSEALEPLRKLVEFFPDELFYHLKLAEVLENLSGKQKEALQEYKEVLRIKPDYPLAPEIKEKLKKAP